MKRKRVQIRRLKCAHVFLAATIASASITAAAQSAPAPHPLPAFDVVSIKPHPDEGMSRMGIEFNAPPDGISFEGGSLDMLLHFVFDVPHDQLLNEPDWVRSSRIDVQAKVAPEDAAALTSLTRAQRWAMLLPALQDRCHLVFHHEMRELQVYTLVVAKGGLKIKESAAADSDAAAPGSAERPLAMSLSDKGMMIRARDATMETFVQMLSQQIGITMVDGTGLTAKYDFTLSWMPDEDSWHLMGLPIPGPPPGGDGQTGPSIFTALEEQLGLKAEARKAPVDVIVIDHIEAPSVN